MKTNGKELIKTLNINPQAHQSLWLISGGYFVVSKTIAKDHGDWETLIFSSDKEGEVKSWLEVYGIRGNEPVVKTVEDFATQGEQTWD